jgi:hypothetical protein
VQDEQASPPSTSSPATRAREKKKWGEEEERVKVIKDISPLFSLLES